MSESNLNAVEEITEEVWGQEMIDGGYVRDTTEEVHVSEEERAKAEDALDFLTDEAISYALRDLEKLLAESTPGEWTKSPNVGDAVIVDGPATFSNDGVVEFYGGPVIFESCGRKDLELILSLKHCAPGLLAMANDHQRLIKQLKVEHEFSNALLRALIQAKQENAALRETLWTKTKRAFKRFWYEFLKE